MSTRFLFHDAASGLWDFGQSGGFRVRNFYASGSINGATLDTTGDAVIGGALGVTGAVTAGSVDAPIIGSEGTFTPVIEGATSAGVGTYATQLGEYTLIGNRCLFNITLIWTAHTGTGVMRVGGLPFASKAGDGRWPVAQYNSAISMTAGHVLEPVISAGSSTVSINSYPSGGGTAATVALDTAGNLYLAGHYTID